jgi:hypothetical protein
MKSNTDHLKPARQIRNAGLIAAGFGLVVALGGPAAIGLLIFLGGLAVAAWAFVSIGKDPAVAAKYGNTPTGNVASSASGTVVARQARRPGAVSAMLLGGILIILGVAGLILADSYKPTAENFYARGGDVLDQESYDNARVISFVLLAGGVTLGVGGFIRNSGRPVVVTVIPGDDDEEDDEDEDDDESPGAAAAPDSTASVYCEQCGAQLRGADRFCADCGAEQPV